MSLTNSPSSSCDQERLSQSTLSSSHLSLLCWYLTVCALPWFWGDQRWMSCQHLRIILWRIFSSLQAAILTSNVLLLSYFDELDTRAIVSAMCRSHPLYFYVIRLSNFEWISWSQLSSLKTSRFLTVLLWLGRCGLYGLLVHCLLNCDLLNLLPIKPILLDLFKLLAWDAHVISLGLVGKLDELSLFHFSFIFPRLDQWLVAEGTFDAVTRWVRHCLQILTTCVRTQLHHCTGNFGVYPLPDADTMEEVFTLRASNHLAILEIFAANDALIRFLSFQILDWAK